MSEDWQRRAVQFAEKRNLLRASSIHVLDLVSEVGEVAKEVLLATEYGQQDAAFRPEIAGEVGDALFSLCLVAEAAGVDLETAFAETLRKYEERALEKGHIGS